MCELRVDSYSRRITNLFSVPRRVITEQEGGDVPDASLILVNSKNESVKLSRFHMVDLLRTNFYPLGC